MSTLIHKRVDMARNGSNPYTIGRMRSGWAVMGDVQFLRGYALLLPDPVVPRLNDLTGAARTQFAADMINLGDVILEVTGALRINYEILGNLEPALHAHLFPRYQQEDAELRVKPVWFYDWQDAPPYDERLHGETRSAILAGLTARGLLLDKTT